MAHARRTVSKFQNFKNMAVVAPNIGMSLASFHHMA